MRVLGELNLRQFVGCVYGSGFEAQPALLKKVADFIPLIGNSPAVVSAVKNIGTFFSTLQQSNIDYPNVALKLPEQDEAYIKKLAGGSGGGHIQPVNREKPLLENHYYQKKIDGRPVSVLFVANADEIEVIGFNEQWLDPSVARPFRYGGAVSHIELNENVKQQLIFAAEKLTMSFGLLGLNSLDAIVQDERVYVLEVNPRLSATVDLYSAESRLFDAHMHACLHRQLRRHCHGALSQQSKAHAIVYAQEDGELLIPTVWPNWVTDTPNCFSGVAGKKKVLEGEPVCTVVAVACCAETAKRLAQDRARMISEAFVIR